MPKFEFDIPPNAGARYYMSNLKLDSKAYDVIAVAENLILQLPKYEDQSLSIDANHVKSFLGTIGLLAAKLGAIEHSVRAIINLADITDPEEFCNALINYHDSMKEEIFGAKNAQTD